MKYTISKQFTMASEITERTLMVGEAFGISLDDTHTFTVYDNFEIEVNPGDVVYITGDSGSGKSLLLKELRGLLPNALSTSELEIDPDQPIIEGVGRNINEALHLLSLVGLNDAFLFLRRYRELSDGQKYRFQLAKLLESQADAWLIDEFCALLDRETAKVVAFNLQKVARRFGKTLVVATTHGDLLDDLAPTVYVRKGIESDVEVEYRPAPEGKRTCSVVANLEIVEGTLDDYRKLARYHYRDHRTRAVQRVFCLRHRETGEIVGTIAYVYPFLNLAGRNLVTDRYKQATSEVARLLNEEVVMISRVIVHPKYRGIGLGTKLIAETMPLTGRRYVEALTVMGRFNPFNEKAGLRRVEYEPKDRMKKLRARLQLLGWNMAMASSTAYNLAKLQELDEATYREIAGEVVRLVHSINCGTLRGVHKRKGGPDREGKGRPPERAEELTMQEIAVKLRAVVPSEKVYLIWENPAWKEVKTDTNTDPEAA